MFATNCPRCGKLFTRTGPPVCPECVKAEAEKYEEVRLYVKENPHVSAQVVSEECNISIKRILHYVREGKLELSEGMADLNLCSQCARPIKAGRLCEKCAKSTANAIADMVAVGAAANEKKTGQPGMYTSK